MYNKKCCVYVSVFVLFFSPGLVLRLSISTGIRFSSDTERRERETLHTTHTHTHTRDYFLIVMHTLSIHLSPLETYIFLLIFDKVATAFFEFRFLYQSTTTTTTTSWLF
jgi:hypothetical protein